MPHTLEKSRPTTVTLKLDPSHRERLKSLTVVKQRTAHYLMKEAIERYLTTQEAQQSVLQSQDDSVAHFETTGLHVTHKAFSYSPDDLQRDKAPVCFERFTHVLT